MDVLDWYEEREQNAEYSIVSKGVSNLLAAVVTFVNTTVSTERCLIKETMFYI